MAHIVIYPDRDALVRAAAEKFVQSANEAITARGRFSVALSGGNTPRDLYALLASDEFRAQVDWSHVHFFWGDERAVPPDDPQSNYRMAYELWLARVNVPAENIHRIRAEIDPADAAREYAHALREFFGAELPRLDFALQGLGPDGHTASLFPQTLVLHENARWCVELWVPKLNAYRLTLTARVLSHAAQIVFLVAGRDKASVLREVLHGAYAPEQLPAQLIQPDAGELWWLLDQDAAQDLAA